MARKKRIKKMHNIEIIENLPEFKSGFLWNRISYCKECYNSGWLLWFHNGPQFLRVPLEHDVQVPTKMKIFEPCGMCQNGRGKIR
jgi:hypothetical protein